MRYFGPSERERAIEGGNNKWLASDDDGQRREKNDEEESNEWNNERTRFQLGYQRLIDRSEWALA
jgi:hypothetical protein